MRLLLRLLAGRRWLLAAVLFATVGSAALGVIVEPLSLRWLVDRGLRAREADVLVGALVLIVSLGMLVRLADYGTELMLARLINRTVGRLVDETLTAFYRSPYATVVAQGESYFVSRVYEEPAKLVRTGLRLVVEFAAHAIAAAVSLAIAFALSWRITILLSLIGPPLLMIAGRFNRRLVQQATAEVETEGVLREVMKRAIGAHRTVRLFGLERDAGGAVGGALGSHLAALYGRSAGAARFRTLSGSILALAEAGVLVAAAREVYVGALTIGGLFAYMTVFWRAMRSGATALGKLPDLAALQAGSVRLADLRDGAEPGTASSASPDGSLALEAVSFDHGDRRVLDNLTMRIDPGQKVLIVGANGSGKTTLAHLLAGFLHGRGDTRVQGLERVSAMLNPLRFAPCSLGQHLRLPPDGPARAEALALLRELDLADRLDDDPETFSDGLKRRAYTAMVLLKEAGVYIFDEPLAAVDEPGKERLMAAIEARTRGKTVVSIMHGDQRFWGMFQRTVRLEAPAPVTP